MVCPLHLCSSQNILSWKVPTRIIISKHLLYRLPLGITWRKILSLVTGILGCCYWLRPSVSPIPPHTSPFAGEFCGYPPAPYLKPMHPSSIWQMMDFQAHQKTASVLGWDYDWLFCKILREDPYLWIHMENIWVELGTDGSVTAEVQNKITKTYSTIIPCTSKWGFIRTQIFLPSLNISGFLMCCKCSFRGVTNGSTAQA